MTATLSTYAKVSRLVNYATGETYGDGEIVTDVIDGCVEPGYPTDLLIVLGNWNPTRWVNDRNPAPLTPAETMPARLAHSLERVGAEVEWGDEWSQCQGCFKAVRTEPDSYSWTPSFAFTDDGFYCHNCMREDGIDALAGYINDPTKCISWCEPEHVVGLGFLKWEPGNEHNYANGWYPGQDDDPTPILAEIRRQHEDAQVVFFLDSVGQFDLRFSAYFRQTKETL